MPPSISLPLATLPHIITSSLALSLLSDLLPRLSHSNANIRKKTVAALYRLALVYPDTLKSAWSKIKDLLMDDQQDASVTAAIVNVVCELGWRRPKDFLPLAPRFFELLIEGGNNWMAIKIIKLVGTALLVSDSLLKLIVRIPDTSGTSTDKKAFGSSDHFNSDNTCYVAVVRMHQWCNPRRDTRRSRRRSGRRGSRIALRYEAPRYDNY